jgi:hypothetical protein
MEGNTLVSKTSPWVKFVPDEWFQNHVKRYFKIITEIGIDTGKEYTEEQKRAMAHCYHSAYWKMMEGRERDRENGFQTSREPNVQAYTTYFIEELGKHMEKVKELYILCAQCRKPSVTFTVNRNLEFNIGLIACEHHQWPTSEDENVIYTDSGFTEQD